TSRTLYVRPVLVFWLVFWTQVSHAGNSVPEMRATLESVSTAVGLSLNHKACTSRNKVVLPSRMIISYECPVPESSRPMLRSEFVARGWVPETHLDGAMFKLRKMSQTVSLLCQFNESICQLRLEYVPKTK